MIYEICKFLKHKIGSSIYNLSQLRLIDKRQIESFNILKSLIDVRTLKPASGIIREIQLNNYSFTKEIIKELEENGLKPFMMYGTLLGAERHKGFVPWDDDIDFGLMRSDFNRLLKYAESKYHVYYQDINRYQYIKSSKKRIKYLLETYPNQVILLKYPFLVKFIKGTNLQDYMQIDFFPFDYYADNYSFVDYRKYFKFLGSKLWKINNTKKEIEFLNEERKNNTNIIENGNKICFGIDNIGFILPYMNHIGFWGNNDIFPLKRMKFEDTEFYAPNNNIKILKYIYGDWENLPKLIEAPHTIERE